ncbi:MAG: MBOAT family protein [Bacteroidetes bacterium]|nr:MBOAT family protein [Bacteroidota bacterium]
MLFSSAIFLFSFLPIVIIGYYLLRGTWRNVFLLISSLVFFAWGGVSYSLLLILSIITNYIFGLLINKNKNNHRARIYLIIGIVLNLMMLGIFKYAGFIAENINQLFEVAGIPPMPNPKILLPIGISFYTFQSLSYLVDLYRKETDVQRNILRLGLYISLFPQLIAGPIVRYHDIASQLQQRITSFEKFSYGVQRFLTGLAKKVLIANSFAVIADQYFAFNPTELSMTMAWMGIIAYTFQIYFDFSGYSDMAIGLGAIFGFRIPENFNYPYASRSIREFWRRWHISLSTWFRDYLYVPMGGNRISVKRTYFNLLIVFFLTGLWHGASWNFIVWGLIHGLFMVIERLGWEKFLHKTWKPLQHIYTLFIVIMAWVLFRADNFDHAWQYYGALFGQTVPQYGLYEISQYLNPELYLITVIAVIASVNGFGLFAKFIKLNLNKISDRLVIYIEAGKALLTNLYFVGLLVLCAMYLIAETYNPFIYFRF